MKKGLVLMMAVLAVLFASCDMSGGANAWEGTWTTEATETVQGKTVTTKSVTVFSKDSFETKISMKMDGSDWVDSSAAKGTLVVEGDTMTTTTTHLKIAVNGKLPDDWAAMDPSMIKKVEGTWAVKNGKLLLTVNGKTQTFTK